MIEVRDVVKRYPAGAGMLTVLHGVSLTVARGECVAVVGPSGAGKSTLLHLIGGLDQPTAGEVSLNGRGWQQLSPREQARVRNEEIGFVFQCYHLLPELTALENTMLPALLGRRREAPAALRRRAQDLLAHVGLAPRAAHRPAELSGGEQQRVAVARALMNRPRVLLCDEPTGNLDSASGAQVLALVRGWQRTAQATMVVVTHEPAVAQAADRVVPLRDGQFVMRDA